MYELYSRISKDIAKNTSKNANYYLLHCVSSLYNGTGYLHETQIRSSDIKSIFRANIDEWKEVVLECRDSFSNCGIPLPERVEWPDHPNARVPFMLDSLKNTNMMILNLTTNLTELARTLTKTEIEIDWVGVTTPQREWISRFLQPANEFLADAYHRGPLYIVLRYLLKPTAGLLLFATQLKIMDIHDVPSRIVDSALLATYKPKIEVRERQCNNS